MEINLDWVERNCPVKPNSFRVWIESDDLEMVEALTGKENQRYLTLDGWMGFDFPLTRFDEVKEIFDSYNRMILGKDNKSRVLN